MGFACTQNHVPYNKQTIVCYIYKLSWKNTVPHVTNTRRCIWILNVYNDFHPNIDYIIHFTFLRSLTHKIRPLHLLNAAVILLCSILLYAIFHYSILFACICPTNVFLLLYNSGHKTFYKTVQTVLSTHRKHRQV